MRIRNKLLEAIIPPVIVPTGVLSLLILAAVLYFNPLIENIDRQTTSLQEQIVVADKKILSDVRQSIINNSKQSLKTEALFIEKRIEQLKQSLLLSAKHPWLMNHFLENERPLSKNTKTKLQSSLRNLVEIYNLYDISLVDKEGVEVLRYGRNTALTSADYGSVSFREAPNDTQHEEQSEWFLKAKRENEISMHVFMDGSRSDMNLRPTLSISIPLRDQNADYSKRGETLGYLRGTVPIDDLVLKRDDTAVHSHLEIRANDLQTVIWRNFTDDHMPSEENFVLTSQVGENLFYLHLILKNDNFEESIAEFEVLADKINHEISNLSNMIEKISIFMNRTPYAIVPFALLVFAMSIIVAIILSRRFSEPIIRLNDATHLISKGDFDHVVPHSNYYDELFELSNSINRMRQHIREQIHTLNEQVERRTIALSKANLQLKVEMQERIKKEEEALMLSRSKSEFLAIMSHEIRTPMNGIISMVNEIIKTTPDPKLQEYASIVKRSSHNLMGILNDVLDFSKIENGKLEIEKVPFDLHESISDVCQTMQPWAEEKGIHIIRKEINPLPTKVLGDPLRITQLLNNLINNAVKFTKEGMIRIMSHYDYESETVRIEVKDTGIGIEESKLHKIFDPFTQSDTSITRMFGGTGLGLTIVHNIITLMEGKIDVQSVPHQGTTFTLHIPLPLCETTSSPSPKIEENFSCERAMNILVVEDNAVNQRVCKILLDKLGHQSTFAVNGKEALVKVQESTFDVILMDCQMPEMDGFEATIQIRNLPDDHPSKNVPIIALTANATTRDKEHCEKVGMNHFLSKPIHRDHLALALQEVHHITSSSS